MCFQNFLICSYPIFRSSLNRTTLFFLFVLCVCLCFCVCIIYVRYAKSFDFHFILLRYVHSYGRRLLFTVGALCMRLVEFCTCKTHIPWNGVHRTRSLFFLFLLLALLLIPLMETSRARSPRFLFGWRGILPRFLSVCFRQTIYANFGKFSYYPLFVRVSQS